MKKILVGTPICESKFYSWIEYSKAISELIVPDGVELIYYVVDTSDDPSLKIELACKNSTLEHYRLNLSYCWITADKPMDKVVLARNKIREYAQIIKADYILFIDSDIVVPPNALQRLLTMLGQFDPYWSVITGCYITTTSKGIPTPCAKLWTKIGYMDFPENYINGKVWSVDMTGLGCTLVPKQIFGLFKFRCIRDTEGKLIASEDTCFFNDISTQRFILQQVKVLFDTGLDINHIIGGSFSWDPDTA